jgi:hypothetical protein
MRLLSILGCLALVGASSGCTIFVVARNGQVFAGGNEDESSRVAFSKHFVRFVPGNKEKKTLGFVAFGYQNNPFSDEAAINEAGLFYDFDALDTLEKPREGKPKAKFTTINEMLTTCRTVEQAVKFLEEVDLHYMSSAQLVLADSLGASAIVERHATTWRRKGRDFQIGTNFRTSTTPVDKITCDRYLTCESMLGARKKVNTNALMEILNRTKAKPESGSTTWYSVLVELKKKRVNLYRKGDFSKATSFDLVEELAKGSRRVDMDDFIGGLLKK